MMKLYPLSDIGSPVTLGAGILFNLKQLFPPRESVGVERDIRSIGNRENGYVIGVKPKVLSQGWLRFAERVVDTAGVLEEDTYDTLVKAFASVPRDQFVQSALSSRATEDTALPIGYGQTISKPSTVARMLGLIGVSPGMRVLEIGCGSGYCSAVMSAAGAQVYAIEYVGLLAQHTRRMLDRLGFYNILVRNGDGMRGWSEHAPFDAIVVSAAFESIDLDLFGQLATGGRLVAPIGSGNEQVLNLWERGEEELHHYQLEPCKFVEGQ